MTKRMLIDASHSEETRVAILKDNKLEEFVYESAMRRPLKGNIFLAKVTRVEPSLQAAFVNFGGNRHGFLPFSEIHPDYFRIPVADQEEFEAMQREQLEEHDKREAVEPDEDADAAEADDAETEDDDSDDADEPEADDADGNKEPAEDDESADVDGNSEGGDDKDEGGNKSRGRGGRGRNNRGGRDGGGRGRGRGGRSAHRSKRPENFGNDEAGQQSKFRFNLRRKYKIQEVIKRGQIMLIQVSREERGNKGAAVSSYLSLPGRYTVLMPNSPRGGGVSRKISNYKDRSKMKDLLGAMDVPAGMSAIVRTAGLERTKAEVKRDMDYLMKLWNSIRELTLKSSAPAEVYQEADLVKRSMRDFYTRDIDEVLVAGGEGHKVAKDFMKMLMPTHAKKIQEYKDEDIPLFHRYQAEEQIAAIGEVEVTLPSGGYLVINPTEALVSVDVNSGRSTKERNIEGTALKTNLEAADEVARQLRLRDLGGLVVIDFIDMEDRRNNGKVERRMRDALADDKARIQVGRISSFGLMELSRQRLNASLSEAQYEVCSHCEGRGLTRTADSASLLVLRSIEAEGIKDRAAEVIVHVPAHVALFLLNYKRPAMAHIEKRFGMTVLIRVDDDMPASSHRVEVSRPSAESDDSEADSNSDASSSAKATEDKTQDDDNNRGRNRRGGRSRGGRGRGRGRRDGGDDVQQDADGNASDKSDGNTADDAQQDEHKPKRRGRKPKSEENAEAPAEDVKVDEPVVEEKPKRGRKKKADIEMEAKTDSKADDKAAEEKPKRGRKKKVEIEEVSTSAKASEDKVVDVKAEESPKKTPAKKTAKKDEPKAEVPAVNDDQPSAASEAETVNAAPPKKKKGWWNK